MAGRPNKRGKSVLETAIMAELLLNRVRQLTKYRRLEATSDFRELLDAAKTAAACSFLMTVAEESLEFLGCKTSFISGQSEKRIDDACRAATDRFMPVFPDCHQVDDSLPDSEATDTQPSANNTQPEQQA